MSQVKCTPPVLTDEVTLFQSLQDANNFFGNFIVPQAGPAQGGVIMQGTSVSFVPPTVVADYYELDALQGDGSTVTNNLVTDTGFISLQAKVDSTALALANLIASLKASGAIASS